MLADTRSGGHAGEPAAGDRQVDEVELLDNRQCQPGVGAGVGGELGQVVGVLVEDGLRPVRPRAEVHLPFTEHGARHAVQRVIVEAHERAAHQVHAVQHQAPRDGRLAAAEVALRRAQPDGTVVSAQTQWPPQTFGDALQHLEIEVDDVPAGEHVRIQRLDAGHEGVQRLRLVRAADGALRHGAAVGVHDIDLVHETDACELAV